MKSDKSRRFFSKNSRLGPDGIRPAFLLRDAKPPLAAAEKSWPFAIAKRLAWASVVL